MRILLATALVVTLLLIEGRSDQMKTHYPEGPLFDAIDDNAGVYLCTMTARQPLSEPAERAPIERGKVTLSVKTTLLGPKREMLILPYSCPTGVEGRTGDLVWPRLDGLGEKNIICVVNPNVWDKISPEIDGIHEAASRVITVANSSDPIVSDFKDICTLYVALGTGDALPSVKKAMVDSRPEVRHFAQMAAVTKLAQTNPDAVIELLKPRSLRWSDPSGPVQAKDLANYIVFKFARIGPRHPWAKPLVRCLATLATHPSPAVRSASIENLASCIQTLEAIGTPPSEIRDLIPAAEKAALNEVLDTQPKVTSDVRLLKQKLSP